MDAAWLVVVAVMVVAAVLVVVVMVVDVVAAHRYSSPSPLATAFGLKSKFKVLRPRSQLCSYKAIYPFLRRWQQRWWSFVTDWRM